MHRYELVTLSFNINLRGKLKQCFLDCWCRGVYYMLNKIRIKFQNVNKQFFSIFCFLLCAIEFASIRWFINKSGMNFVIPTFKNQSKPFLNDVIFSTQSQLACRAAHNSFKISIFTFQSLEGLSHLKVSTLLFSFFQKMFT